MIERNDWIDTLDREIFPFVEYPGFENRYPTIELVGMSEARIDELREVSEKLFRIFCRVTEVFQNCSDEFMEDMEIPAGMRPFLHRQNMLGLPTWLSRFDFVFDSQRRLHMVEINADTPCAVIEAFYGNRMACRYYRRKNPNRDSYEELKDWLKYIFDRTYSIEVDLQRGRISAEHPFVFSCFEDYVEDRGTTLFLMQALKEAIGSLYPDNMVTFASFYDLGVNPDGSVQLPDGRTAAVLYRLHPMELLIEETAEDGAALGAMFMQGYQEGRFQLFNPPEAIIMQSKGFQALVWSLAHSERADEIFTGDELHTIRTYMLPSYFERDFAVQQAAGFLPPEKWIKKPIWGREGNGIQVVDEADRLVSEKYVPNADEVVQRDSDKVLVQKFVAQPSSSLRTDEGLLKGYLTLSCFMLGERASAVYSRFSPEEIAGTEAYWAPIYIK